MKARSMARETVGSPLRSGPFNGNSDFENEANWQGATRHTAGAPRRGDRWSLELSLYMHLYSNDNLFTIAVHVPILARCSCSRCRCTALR
jgi:hypothetical protein